MRNHGKFLAALALFCLLALPVLAQDLAQNLMPPPPPGGSSFPFTLRRMGLTELKNIGLTDEQMAQVNRVYEENRRTVATLNAAIQKGESELRTLLDSPNVDVPRASRAVSYLVALRARLSMLTSGMMLQMRQAMTQEQWRKLAALQLGSPIDRTPPPLPPGVYRPGEGSVTAPVLVSKVEPIYPPQARDAKVEGVVTLSVIIGTNGAPEKILVIKSDSPALIMSAMEAVRQWRFQPGMKDGQPVRVSATIDITFRLK